MLTLFQEGGTGLVQLSSHTNRLSLLFGLKPCLLDVLLG